MVGDRPLPKTGVGVGVGADRWCGRSRYLVSLFRGLSGKGVA